MHKDWCGKPCSDCKNPCQLDESISCSPDCEFLIKNGGHTRPECQECDALTLYRVPICYNGIIHVKAASSEEAIKFVCNMPDDEMCEKSYGAWTIDDAEEDGLSANLDS